jgi:signal transduction histidine kinase
MRNRSLSTRLIISSAIVSIVLLVSAGLLLAGLFSAALERNFDARLRAVLDGLLANVELGADGAPTLVQQLADTRFTLPLSGWYWQIEPPPGKNIPGLASESLLEQRLKPEAQLLATRDAGGIASFYISDSQIIEGRAVKLRAIEQAFTLPGSADKYSFLVSGNFDELRQEVQAFRHTLFAILAMLGTGLLAAVFFQVKFGLRPLQNMQESLTAIRKGQAEKLDGDFPSELQPVADEFNLLIQANTEVIDRARTQVGNLAHALKTPLSVLTNEAQSNRTPFAKKVSEQTQIMRDQVSLYLDRARRAARAQTIGASAEVEPILAGLGRTIMRINHDRGIKIAVAVSAGLKFRGESQDLEEMAGNLIDNASKWSNHAVQVTATPLADASDVGRSWLLITVDDDGPGLPADKRADAVKRGRRLDETKPGSGLGLSIVTETAVMYGGSVTLGDADLGGLRVQLKLPAVGE